MYNNNMLRNVLKRLKMDRNGISRDENQYLSLIRDILNDGEEIKGRIDHTIHVVE